MPRLSFEEAMAPINREDDDNEGENDVREEREGGNGKKEALGAGGVGGRKRSIALNDETDVENTLSNKAGLPIDWHSSGGRNMGCYLPPPFPPPHPFENGKTDEKEEEGKVEEACGERDEERRLLLVRVPVRVVNHREGIHW